MSRSIKSKHNNNNPTSNKSTTTTTRHRNQIPSNWPPEITYLNLPQYSPLLPASTINLLSAPSTLRSTPSSSISIRKITTPPTHPALNQNGLFASRNLSPGSFVCDYLGRYHTLNPDDTDDASDYDLVLVRDLDGEGNGVGIDARFAGNEGRMVNDYRGVKDKPNVEFRERIVEVEKARSMGGGGAAEGELRMALFVIKGEKGWKGVKKGEELLVSYGRGFWNERLREEIVHDEE